MRRQEACIEMPNGADIEKATVLYKELSEHLTNLKDKSLLYQARNARDAVKHLEEAGSAEEKEVIISKYHRILFPARGGLSDVVLWADDYETRVSLNEPLDRIGKDLWAMMGRRR